MKEFTPQEQFKRYTEELTPLDLSRIQSNDSASVLLGLRYLYKDYRKLAVLEWHLHGDAGNFRDHMKTALDYEFKSFMESKSQRPEILFDTPIGLIFDALNTGDEVFAREYTQFLDDNLNDKKKSRTHEDNALTMCGIVLVSGRYEEQFPIFIEKLKKGYSSKRWIKLYPYALAIEAIWARDSVTFNEQMTVIAETHRKMLRSIFDDYEDKLLCLRGLALCNLARMKGMTVSIDHPYIPKKLI